MKKLLPIFLILFSFQTGFSQSATSIANGNWMNPSTWNCGCIPMPNYTVTINHNVALDTSWYVSSGGITINSGASLIKNNPTRDLLVNGGNLTNHGTLDVRYLFTQTGTFSNSGTLNASSFLNYLNFTNTGTIQNMDSLYSTGSIINNGSFLNIDSITTGGTFTNNGICTYHQFTNTGQYTNNKNLTFTDLTNTGTFINSDTIHAINSVWNTETFTNMPSGYFNLGTSLLNADSIQHNALFNNNGKVVVNDSWYNSDTVKGVSGTFQVADSSVNWGYMKGTFNFCDLTPPVSSPFVDYNFGTISTGITWCAVTGITQTDVAEINIYPNPATDFITIDIQKKKPAELKIYNACGILIDKFSNPDRIDVSEYSAGLYFISIVSENKTFIRKIQIIK